MTPPSDREQDIFMEWFQTALKNLEQQSLRLDTNNERIGALKTELAEKIAGLKEDMAAMKAELARKLEAINAEILVLKLRASLKYRIGTAIVASLPAWAALIYVLFQGSLK